MLIAVSLSLSISSNTLCDEGIRLLSDAIGLGASSSSLLLTPSSSSSLDDGQTVAASDSSSAGVAVLVVSADAAAFVDGMDDIVDHVDDDILCRCEKEKL